MSCERVKTRRFFGGSSFGKLCEYQQQKSHESMNCKNKVCCPECEIGWRQTFMVEKDDSLYKGQMFYTCTRKIVHQCNYWKLVGPPKKGDHDYEEGESSNARSNDQDFNTPIDVDDLSSKLEKCAEISESRNVDVSLRVYEFTFRKWNN